MQFNSSFKLQNLLDIGTNCASDHVQNLHLSDLAEIACAMSHVPGLKCRQNEGPTRADVVGFLPPLVGELKHTTSSLITLHGHQQHYTLHGKV